MSVCLNTQVLALSYIFVYNFRPKFSASVQFLNVTCFSYDNQTGLANTNSRFYPIINWIVRYIFISNKYSKKKKLLLRLYSEYQTHNKNLVENLFRGFFVIEASVSFDNTTLRCCYINETMIRLEVNHAWQFSLIESARSFKHPKFYL